MGGIGLWSGIGCQKGGPVWRCMGRFGPVYKEMEIDPPYFSCTSLRKTALKKPLKVPSLFGKFYRIFGVFGLFAPFHFWRTAAIIPPFSLMSTNITGLGPPPPYTPPKFEKVR